MATAADLRALEDECPWLREDFQADLAALRASTADEARRFAADMRVLARLVAQVPRCRFDERGATPWTSFRREVAVARRISDVAAAAETRAAVQLAGPMPRTRALLEQGALTVPRARAFLAEVEAYSDEVVGALDAQLAERIAGLPAWRIVQEVRRAVSALDPEAAALRTAGKNDGRSVLLQPQPDDQAVVVVQGPAVPLTRWYDTLDGRARALKQAGDPRTLAQLRFDLVTSTFPCATHAPADAAADPSAQRGPADVPTGATPEAGLRPSFVEAASTDCRMSRPVQAAIAVPVETALGLSNEPAWLDGYGWLSAPTSRLLLVEPELRRICTRSGTGELVDVADRDVRPPPTPGGVRAALLQMVTEPVTTSATGSRVEQQHDPSPPLREYVALRDRFCDGPTGARVPARRSHLDHDTPHPTGPTAAWNLRARGDRTHQLKHAGWTPLRTPGSTLWFSPAGQVVEVPDHTGPPPGVDHDPYEAAGLPGADELAALDRDQLQPVAEQRPWLPAAQRPEPVDWLWLDGQTRF